MLFRAIALSLAILIGGGTLIPLATDSVEAGPKNKRKKRQAKKYKKYSKKWWRQYRAMQRKKAANRKRSRALRLRQLRLARAAANGDTTAAQPKAAKQPKVKTPNTKVAADNWSQAQASPGELRFRVDDSAGSQVGTASISVVGPAVGETVDMPQKKAVGGVATTSLRREVINKMVQENGWVVNDYQKQIGGRTVYVVEAQSQAKNGQLQSRMYYFTEVDGRIYSVATNSSVDQHERLAAESEKVLDSLPNRVRAAERASVNNR